MMILRIMDFETTGLPPDASVCEAAFVDMVGEPPFVSHPSNVSAAIRRNWSVPRAIGAVPLPMCAATSPWCSLVVPTTEMSVEALATHHITAAEAHDNGIPWEEAEGILQDGASIYVAHNADFEKEFFNPDGSRWIDTYKVALRLWPDAPRHTNQVLRYFLDLDVGARAMPPHRALPDAWVTAHLLLAALKLASIDDMIQWSNAPPYLTKLPFGKHFGKKFSEVPRSYLEWMVKQDDMDAGVIAAAKRELKA